jgi:hypothetical protein
MKRCLICGGKMKFNEENNILMCEDCHAWIE